MSIEAMKLALDCLEDIFGKDKIDVGAINALRQAIADAEKQEPDDLTIAYMSGFHDGKNKCTPQPEQEPVAWMREDEDCTDCIVWEQTEEHTIPLYTTPTKREWVGLTDEEINASSKGHMTRIGFARAVEAKLKEKNCG